MAMRVLLADESSTIKKVMQLALQDFGVEVKSVQLGVDVIEVAKSFQPDIIFADVLLQKLNGYEVSYEVKKDEELKTIPVVLMWSSFMELDEQKYAASGADGKLEKPFDVEDLRALVLEQIPKAKDQRLAPYLIFSPSISTEFIEDEKQKAANPPNLPQEQSVVLTTDGTDPDPGINNQPPQVETRSNEELPQIDSNFNNDNSELSGLSSITTSETDHQITNQGDDNWNMDDFQNVNDFADEESHETSNSTEEENEDFESLNLSHLDETGLTRTTANTDQQLPDPPDNIEESYDQPNDFNQQLDNELSTGTTAGVSSEDEGWEKQNLDEFRIDFDDEDDEDGFHVTNVTNISNQDVDDEFLLNDQQNQQPKHEKPKTPPKRTDLSADDFISGTDGNNNFQDESGAGPETHIVDLDQLEDEGFDSIENFDFQQIKTPPEKQNDLTLDQSDGDANSNLSLEQDPREMDNSTDLSTRIAMDPAMRAVLEAQIEKVLRDQSNTLIADIVRRVLPEIATDVIKKELNKLLDEDE